MLKFLAKFFNAFHTQFLSKENEFQEEKYCLTTIFISNLFRKYPTRKAITHFSISNVCNSGKNTIFCTPKTVQREITAAQKMVQHPPISRRLPLFDVQIFTIPRRACLRGSRRCAWVFYLHRVHRAFRSENSSLPLYPFCVAQRRFSRKENNGSARKSPRSFSETDTSLRIPARVSSSGFPPDSTSKKIFPRYSRSMNQFCRPYHYMRRTYACLNSEIEKGRSFRSFKRKRLRGRTFTSSSFIRKYSFINKKEYR